ncbi:hypothetical protein DL89DRAFT_257508 [Linderina pennispora]|uniref:Uncharacterized protein n=1 Tax=Linderina pennispora TaxID=61395 RepID=A0A1Y1WAI5_9FUNG|nr:uncharacterized protein DL89DRAFT_257508 [Linderina pennispora]ORX70246.1 hypothetical protein DL89DRAFT_257508 [Linderina pennispora]
MLSRIGVQHANLGVEGDKELDARAFEEFYDKTVDLADLCQLPDVNERLNQVANSYHDFALRKEELASEAKRLAVIPRIKQRLTKIPQLEKELDDTVARRQEMEQQTEEQTAGLELIEKDISYLRMEVAVSQESEEQAMSQLKAKRKELEQLTAEFANKRRMLETRKEMYRKKRPLTAVEHSERMANDLRVALEGVKGDDASLHDIRDAYVSKLTEIISNSDAVDVTNGYLDQVFANTIDSVANEDVESLDARRASRRLSAAAMSASGRVLSAQLLCYLYTQSKGDQSAITEDDLRNQLTEFARERQWNPEFVVQAMYEVFGKKLAKRFREDRTHMVKLLWE